MIQYYCLVPTISFFLILPHTVYIYVVIQNTVKVRHLNKITQNPGTQIHKIRAVRFSMKRLSGTLSSSNTIAHIFKEVKPVFQRNLLHPSSRCVREHTFSLWSQHRTVVTCEACLHLDFIGHIFSAMQLVLFHGRSWNINFLIPSTPHTV